MNSSDLPSRIVKAFAVNGTKNTIPVDSSTTTDNNGVATFDKGFPPITMQPLSAGGLPPDGKDVNGALFSVSAQQQWMNAGGSFPFSSDFAAAVNGYPKGAILPNSTLTGNWINLNEGNSTGPESSSGALTGWVPLNSYGLTTLSGLTNASQTLSSVQAARDRIVLTGTLTANINIVFPSWIKGWVVSNKCTGNFSVICKTASGTGVIVDQGTNTQIFCDGTNITSDLGSAAYRQVGNSNSSSIPDMSFFPLVSTDTGQLQLPNGVIIKWGISDLTDTATAVTFAEAFPTKVFFVSKNTYNTNINTSAVFEVVNLTRTGFTAANIGTINRGSSIVSAPVLSGMAYLAIGI